MEGEVAEELKTYLQATGLRLSDFSKEQLDCILRAMEMAVNNTEWKTKHKIFFPHLYK